MSRTICRPFPAGFTHDAGAPPCVHTAVRVRAGRRRRPGIYFPLTLGDPRGFLLLRHNGSLAHGEHRAPVAACRHQASLFGSTSFTGVEFIARSLNRNERAKNVVSYVTTRKCTPVVSFAVFACGRRYYVGRHTLFGVAAARCIRVEQQGIRRADARPPSDGHHHHGRRDH